MKQSQKLLKSKLLDKYPLIYGFTTRVAGDFRRGNLDILGKIFKIDQKNIITMSQVHGTEIIEISDIYKGESKVDGMVTRLKNKFLVVKVADCVPILFYDPIKEIVAVCHAGWRGTIDKIQQKIIQKMISMGSSPSDIISIIGPHISPCCYNINSERALKFKDYVSKKNNEFYLDLGKANVEFLKKADVTNIEDLNICTSCQNDLFFSYRKEGQNFGEQVGLIGLI